MENRSAMPFQITPSAKKLVLHESHKNLPSHNPIWKQLSLPCLEGHLCFEAMAGRSTDLSDKLLKDTMDRRMESNFWVRGNLTEDALD
ncbi:unnamed protein product [Brassica oleracea]|uniref:(rape) hypothetical protein n=1 Tax=Brassica napus TaxID=3708 RepID=A0A816JRX9_BRANA|nr:unnamed protein product [Brassica napus]